MRYLLYAALCALTPGATAQTRSDALIDQNCAVTIYSPDTDKVTCKGPRKPATGADLSSYKRRWETVVRSAAQAEYIHFCGLRTIQWQMQVQGYADHRLMYDPSYGRMSAAQRRDLQTWRTDIRNTALDFLGRDGKSCRAIVGAPFIRTLDQMAYPVLR